MVTYVVSQHAKYWDVARYIDDLNGQPIIRTRSEKEALNAVIKEAAQEKPSRVLHIALNGESNEVARFDAR